jgi:hypothetical protein
MQGPGFNPQHHKTKNPGWWHMPVIPVLERLRQGVVSSRARLHSKTLSQTKKQTNIKKIIQKS